MKNQVIVIMMEKRKGTAQIYELLFMPPDEDSPEFINIEDEEGKNVLAIHSHYTTKGVLVFKEIPVQDRSTH